MKVKKIVVSSLLFSIVGLSILACKKDVFSESVDPGSKNEIFENRALTNSYGVSTDGKLLIFNTIADFDNLSDAPESMNQKEEEQFFADFSGTVNAITFPKFIQTKKYVGWTLTGQENNYPSLVLKMLNADGAVQVGNYIYRLDFDNQYVYVISTKDKSIAYNDLVNGNISNKSVKQFNWDQEVVDIMENRFVKESQASPRKNFKKITDKKDLDFLLTANYNNQTASATIAGKHYSSVLKARYRWTPICWDLYCKVVMKETTTEITTDNDGNITSHTNTTNANVPVRLSWQRSYKKKNSTIHGYQICSNEGTGYALGQSYQGLKALSRFILGATAEAKVNGEWQLMAFGTPDQYVNGTAYQVRINAGY